MRDDATARAIGESLFLSSQGFSEWPTLDECIEAAGRALEELEHVGWVFHTDADGGNDALWWSDKFPESPADGARPVYAPVCSEKETR